MKLKLACADFTFPLLPHDRTLDLISMLEVEGVDIGLFEGRSHLWPSKVFGNIAKSANALSSKLRDRGLHLADVFLQPAADFAALAANRPEEGLRRKARAIFQKTLEFTALCGGRHVSALPGVRVPGETKGASLGRCVEELAWRVEQAREHKIIFSVEAHIGSIVPTPAEAARLIALTPGLTLTLDYTHFTRGGIPDARIETLIPMASHFHARASCKGRLQASFKNNTIDYARVLQKLKAADYRGFVGIEYVWIDWARCNEVDNLSETVLLRNFLRSVPL